MPSAAIQAAITMVWLDLQDTEDPTAKIWPQYEYQKGRFSLDEWSEDKCKAETRHAAVLH